MVMKTQTQNGPETILYLNVSLAMDTMINFDGDANADEKCKQAFTWSPKQAAWLNFASLGKRSK